MAKLIQVYSELVQREQELDATRVPALENFLKYYHLSNKAVRDFLTFCEMTKYEKQPIHGYPILHQLFYSRLILVNCNYSDRWRKLIRKIILVLKQPEI